MRSLLEAIYLAPPMLRPHGSPTSCGNTLPLYDFITHGNTLQTIVLDGIDQQYFPALFVHKGLSQRR
jgi:hypothetical protein